jgi:hypothetical protein
MRHVLIWSVSSIVLASFQANLAVANDAMKVVDSISGSSQESIQVAMPEFLRRGMTLEGYRIVVVDENGHTVVLFEDLNTTVGQRGSPSKKPSFEVELSEDGARIVRANFVR